MSMEEMKAAVRRSYGSPKDIQIEALQKPILGDNQLLIKVRATTVNRTDCANLTAKPFIMRFILGFLKPRKIVLGTDFAGEVVSVGKNLTEYVPKDMVFGFTDIGLESQAEYIVITPKGNVFTIPKNIDYQQAVASLEGAHYAYTFIHKVNIQAGQSILINGATGGIGSALIQFVNQFDVHITATCNTKNKSLIKALGANTIYDYNVEDFTKGIEKYDFIFDAVGKSTYGKCKPLLKEKGIYISSELGPYSQNLFYAIASIISKKKKVLFPLPYKTEKTIPYIREFLQKGIFKPVIDREYTLETISEAYAYVITGEKTGNVIITI